MNKYLVGAINYYGEEYSVKYWYGDTLEDAIQTAEMILGVTVKYHWYCYPL